jgi:type IV secretion system protein TrbF
MGFALSKRNTHSAPGSDEIYNPYLAARREWDERYGEFITRARNW